jgi:hypothetical protein
MVTFLLKATTTPTLLCVQIAEPNHPMSGAQNVAWAGHTLIL